jgi:putative FmdB family regulatory protein
MPIYEYRCTECGENFEKFVRSAAQQETLTCPKCRSPQVKKAISLFGVGGASKSKSASAAACAPAST